MFIAGRWPQGIRILTSRIKSSLRCPVELRACRGTPGRSRTFTDVLLRQGPLPLGYRSVNAAQVEGAHGWLYGSGLQCMVQMHTLAGAVCKPLASGRGEIKESFQRRKQPVQVLSACVAELQGLIAPAGLEPATGGHTARCSYQVCRRYTSGHRLPCCERGLGARRIKSRVSRRSVVHWRSAR